MLLAGIVIIPDEKPLDAPERELNGDKPDAA